MQEVVQQVDYLILTQGELFRLAARMLDDGDVLPQDDLPLLLDQRIPAERCRVRRPVPHGDQGKIELPVGQEEGVRIERDERAGAQAAVQPPLESELDPASRGLARVGEHMIVGEEQLRGDQGAGAEAGGPVGEAADDDASDRAGDAQPPLQITNVDQIVPVDDAFQAQIEFAHGARGRGGQIVEQRVDGGRAHTCRALRSQNPQEPALGPFGRIDPELVPFAQLLDMSRPLGLPRAPSSFGLRVTLRGSRCHVLPLQRCNYDHVTLLFSTRRPPQPPPAPRDGGAAPPRGRRAEGCVAPVSRLGS
ncbi:MAG: hypothetical protein AVDCRST_MAG88-4700, partial [uncultured Thermomicrobiales bacterium]